MRKLLTVILVIAVLLPIGAAAAKVDLSSMSTDELIALNFDILNELISRGDLKTVTVPAGEYVVGEHIPAGEYSVSLSKGQIMAMLTVNEYDQMYTLSADSGIGRLMLKNGDVVSIIGSVEFVKYTGLGF